jgi:hypothetical protein
LGLQSVANLALPAPERTWRELARPFTERRIAAISRPDQIRRALQMKFG